MVALLDVNCCGGIVALLVTNHMEGRLRACLAFGVCCALYVFREIDVY